jgi:hypothetical protein
MPHALSVERFGGIFERTPSIADRSLKDRARHAPGRDGDFVHAELGCGACARGEKGCVRFSSVNRRWGQPRAKPPAPNADDAPAARPSGSEGSVSDAL